MKEAVKFHRERVECWIRGKVVKFFQSSANVFRMWQSGPHDKQHTSDEHRRREGGKHSHMRQWWENLWKFSCLILAAHQHTHPLNIRRCRRHFSYFYYLLERLRVDFSKQQSKRTAKESQKEKVENIFMLHETIFLLPLSRPPNSGGWGKLNNFSQLFHILLCCVD